MSNEPIKSENIPVLQGQLELVKQELKSDISALRLETKAGFEVMESRFASMDSRFTSIDAQFKSIDAQFTSIDAQFKSLHSVIFGIKAMMEEQKTQNLYVIDGYNFLFNKYENSERRLDNVEQKVFGIEQKS